MGPQLFPTTGTNASSARATTTGAASFTGTGTKGLRVVKGQLRYGNY